MSDWKSIENEREKYAAYLASREWAVLKEAVHKRSRGECERRKKYSSSYDHKRCPLPGNAVHHLTYERKYSERLEDLQHNCNACHDFTHAKSDFDPLEHVEWCRYLLVCPNPVPPSVAYFGVGNESISDICTDYPKAYAMFLLHQREYDHSLVPSICDSDESLGYDTAFLVQQVIEDIQVQIGLPFDLAAWLRFGAPTIDHLLYDESIKQVNKCAPKRFKEARA